MTHSEFSGELRYLLGPVIQPPTAWDFPPRLLAVMFEARLLQIRRGLQTEAEQELASEEEALGYLSCVSLTAPLDRTWAEIFMYLGQRVFPRWQLIPEGQSISAAIGLADKRIELDSQQLADLHRFRRWLRQKVTASGARNRAAAALAQWQPK